MAVRHLARTVAETSRMIRRALPEFPHSERLTDEQAPWVIAATIEGDNGEEAAATWTSELRLGEAFVE